MAHLWVKSGGLYIRLASWAQRTICPSGEALHGHEFAGTSGRRRLHFEWHRKGRVNAPSSSPLPVGLVMKSFLRRLFHRITCTPFIGEAERRAKQAVDIMNPRLSRPG